MLTKAQLRQKIWTAMEASGVAAFPKPITGRIPNFIGAESAAQRLAELPEWRAAKIVKVNPDSPQRPVRQLALEQGKILYVPSPRLRAGFVRLTPAACRGREREAASIRGFMRFGKRVALTEIDKIDFVVTGCVAVARDGARVGKSGGFGDMEIAMLNELGLITKAPITTTVHDIQIVEAVPMAANDSAVDIIATPTQTIRTHTKYPRPKIIWELAEARLDELHVLRELQQVLSESKCQRFIEAVIIALISIGGREEI